MNTSSSLETFGEALFNARKAAGLSIRQLATKARVDHANVARLESGERTNPTPETVVKLATALGVEPSEWLELIGVDPDRALPPPRTYFRRKLGVNADEADVLARLIEDYQAQGGAR
ncbi:MAG TPA: helix-turn-helix transcriptional regulator [Frankiaceae bacterium]|nr:helix-turn-helix transcriptional regulator [Frankiaceae bacterium]